MTKIRSLLLGGVLVLAAVGGATAASTRITGSNLSALLYGRTQTIYFPGASGIRTTYDAKGIQTAGGKRTGTIVKSTKNMWCDYFHGKLDTCVSVWREGGRYVARTTDGRIGYRFTVN